MHRHGYKGRKFGRERDQRRALMRGLANSLVLNGSLETTLPKAKDLRPYTEKLITKAKNGSLHSRRQVISGLATLEAAHKLVDDIAPRLDARSSGYLRIKALGERRGDNAQLASISFVDDLTKKLPAKPVAKPATPKKTAKTRKPAAKRPIATKGGKK